MGYFDAKIWIFYNKIEQVLGWRNRCLSYNKNTGPILNRVRYRSVNNIQPIQLVNIQTKALLNTDLRDAICHREQTMCARARCLKCNRRMKHRTSVCEASCHWSLQDVWMFRGHTVSLFHPWWLLCFHYTNQGLYYQSVLSMLLSYECLEDQCVIHSMSTYYCSSECIWSVYVAYMKLICSVYVAYV